MQSVKRSIVLTFDLHPRLCELENTPDVATIAFMGDQLALTTEAVADPVNVPPWHVAGPDSALHSFLERGAVLGRFKGLTCQFASLSQLPPGWVTLGLRDYLLHTTPDFFKVVNAAAQLNYWLATQWFCSRCGVALRFGSEDRSLNCQSCGYRSYPKVSPCVIAVVYREQEIILAQSLRHQGPMHSCLAGFIECGESAEEAVHREVKEEAGVELGELTYVASQAWPFPHQLMLGFLAEYKSGDIVIDTSELRSAGWYSIDALPTIPPRQTIATRLINHARQKLGGLPPL